ncbi:MAG: GNAT family N-acetyltransferase [Deltaproteobacteria bacterium]|nr:GNAT family N-acetyltransferase [Deltaproteobacteria bacterium]
MTAPDTIRLLRGEEREALVALLDGWVVPGWPGRPGDFFRRYLDADPSFEPRNVVVAERAGRLVGCVQIFPRALRVRPGEGPPRNGFAQVPLGGIGSVFTHPEVRGSGVASALLERAIAEMQARGLELSLLFATRHGFYGRLGWQLWPRERGLWLRGEAYTGPDPARRVDRFDPARDLDAAYALHTAHSGALEGTCVRDAAFFRAQLAFAGNPEEDFLLARTSDGALAAYARAAALEGVLLATELARRPEPDAAEALADLVAALLAPRDPDPLAPSASAPPASAPPASGSPRRTPSASAPPCPPPSDLRRFLVAPCLHDPALEGALVRRGVVRQTFSSRDAMLRVLDPDALARRTGRPRTPGESDAAWLARVLPPERLVLWPADRF